MQQKKKFRLMKILLLGKNGQVGWELQRTIASLGEIVALGRQELDLTEPHSIRSTIRSVKPDLIVNAAAYTAVDRSEEEQDLAMAINGTAPGIMAEEALQIKARLVHYSTDYVFDGTKNEPYREVDQPKPINFYGKTKLAGEEAIKVTGCDHIILRTSWVYSLRGQNFLLTILRLAAERDELSIVSDQFGSPTWARMIAEATSQIIVCDRVEQKLRGVYHLAAAGQTSWHGFAEAILKLSQPVEGILPKIKAISTTEYQTEAARPAYSVLNCSALKIETGIKLPNWHYSLKQAIDENFNQSTCYK